MGYMQGQHAFLALQHLGFALYPSPDLGQQTYTLCPPALVFIYDVKTGIVPQQNGDGSPEGTGSNPSGPVIRHHLLKGRHRLIHLEMRGDPGLSRWPVTS